MLGFRRKYAYSHYGPFRFSRSYTHVLIYSLHSTFGSRCVCSKLSTLIPDTISRGRSTRSFPSGPELITTTSTTKSVLPPSLIPHLTDSILTQAFTNCFSTSFRYLDNIFGTDKKYHAFRAEQKAKKLAAKNGIAAGPETIFKED